MLLYLLFTVSVAVLVTLPVLVIWDVVRKPITELRTLDEEESFNEMYRHLKETGDLTQAFKAAHH